MTKVNILYYKGNEKISVLEPFNIIPCMLEPPKKNFWFIKIKGKGEPMKMSKNNYISSKMSRETYKIC